MCCGINACSTHDDCTGFSRSLKQGRCKCDPAGPCNIILDSGVLVIKPTSVAFLNGTRNLYLYEVTYPFTREELMCLNDIDSLEPDAYIRALKRQKRMQHANNIIPRRSDTTEYIPPRIAFRDNCEKLAQVLREELVCEEQVIREVLAKHKSLAREQERIIYEKDREIEELKAKLKS